MRRALSWLAYTVGHALLVVSERIQGDGEGPWGEPSCFDGNQFFDADFTPDG